MLKQFIEGFFMSYTTILESFKNKIKENVAYFPLMSQFFGTIQVPVSTGYGGEYDQVTYQTVKVDYTFPFLDSVVTTHTSSGSGSSSGTTSTSYSTVSYVTDHICTALDNINSAIYRNVHYLFDDPSMPDRYGERMNYTQFYAYAKSSTGFYEFLPSETKIKNMFKQRWELYYARNNIMDSLSNVEKGDYLNPYSVHINNIVLIMDFFQTLFFKLGITGSSSGLGTGTSGTVSKTADYVFWFERGFANLFKYYIVNEMRQFDKDFPEVSSFNGDATLASAMSDANISSKIATIASGSTTIPAGTNADGYRLHSVFQNRGSLSLSDLESRLKKGSSYAGSIVSDFNVFSWILDEVKDIFGKFSESYDLVNNFVLDDDVQYTESGKLARTSWKSIGSSTYGRYCTDLGKSYSIYTEAVKICESKNFTATDRKQYLGRIAQWLTLKQFDYFNKAQVWYRRVILIRQKYGI